MHIMSYFSSEALAPETNVLVFNLTCPKTE
jgi:hypothetical protein